MKTQVIWNKDQIEKLAIKIYKGLGHGGLPEGKTRQADLIIQAQDILAPLDRREHTSIAVGLSKPTSSASRIMARVRDLIAERTRAGRSDAAEVNLPVDEPVVAHAPAAEDGLAVALAGLLRTPEAKRVIQTLFQETIQEAVTEAVRDFIRQDENRKQYMAEALAMKESAKLLANLQGYPLKGPKVLVVGLLPGQGNTLKQKLEEEGLRAELKFVSEKGWDRIPSLVNGVDYVVIWTGKVPRAATECIRREDRKKAALVSSLQDVYGKVLEFVRTHSETL